MKISYYHINAFAANPFTGNPAAVFVLDEWLPDDKLQLIARENYLPATAYIVRNNEGYQIRWFTPEYEIDLCGHGSLASAYVIFTFLEPNRHSANLFYPAGELYVSKNDSYFTLNFPAKNLEEFTSDTLINGLGAKPSEIYQYKKERCLAVFNTEEEIKQIKPDMVILKNLLHRGVIITAKSKNYDFVSRTFYPKKSTSEDAVTGSSHCLLIPYWSKRLNKEKMHAYQASHRGGELFCELQNDRVLISGKAIMYAKGTIYI